jgi:hypothetical protein
MSIADDQFRKLQRMVEDGLRESAPRTEAEEDRLALETMILELEGPDALERYQASRSDDDAPGWDDRDRYRGRGQ